MDKYTLKESRTEQEITTEKIFLALVAHHGRTTFRRNELAQFFFGSDEIAENCVSAGWLKPRINGNRLSGFDLEDIVRCLARVRQEGRPSTKATKAD